MSLQLKGPLGARGLGGALLLGLIGAPGLFGALAATGPGRAGAALQVNEAESTFMQAEALLRGGRTQQAREQYRSIIERYPQQRYPRLTWRAAARVRLGDIRWRSAARDLAGADYVAVLEEEPRSPWSSRARLGLAAVSLAADRWQEAVDLLQRIVVDAETAQPEADPAAAAEARRRLVLIDRFAMGAVLSRPLWTRSRALVPSGLVWKRPVAVAASADGQVLVVDEGVPLVALIGADHTTFSRLGYNAHSRPWWGSDGLPYLPTLKAGVIALGGSRLGFLAKEGNRPVLLKALAAGTRTPGGRWYLLDRDPPRVLRFGSDSDYQGLATATGEEPVDLAMDPLGRLLVLDRKSNSVIRFHADGRREGVLMRGSWRRPEALAVDGLGNVYVLDRDEHVVDVFDTQGNRLFRLGPTLPGGVGLRSPRDVAVDGQGRVYVADRGAGAVFVVQ